MPARVKRKVLEERVSGIRDTLQNAFPNLNIEVSYETMERGEDAYLWIKGDLPTAEKALSKASDLTSELLETENIYLSTRLSREVWCTRQRRRSYPISERVSKPSPDLLFSQQDRNGVIFNCFRRKRDKHEHDWGNVKPQW